MRLKLKTKTKTYDVPLVTLIADVCHDLFHATLQDKPDIEHKLMFNGVEITMKREGK